MPNILKELLSRVFTSLSSRYEFSTYTKFGDVTQFMFRVHAYKSHYRLAELLCHLYV